MKRLALCAFASLCLCVSASAQSRAERVLYAGSVVAVGVATVWDDETTVRAFGTGAFREGNPVLVDSTGGYNRPLKYALSGGVATANHFLLWRRGSHKTAILVNVILAGAQGVAAFNNERQIRLLAPEPAAPKRALRLAWRF